MNLTVKDQILELMQRGNKIEAIKLYRSVTNVGLKEAKDAVEAIEIGLPPVLPAEQSSPPSNELQSQMRYTLMQGNKIEAIKLYREATGVGLKEAKDAVEAIERGESITMEPAKPIPTPDLQSLRAQVVAHLRQGNKIEAIKTYRSFTGVGLKEAKDAVEEIERMTTL